MKGSLPLFENPSEELTSDFSKCKTCGAQRHDWLGCGCGKMFPSEVLVSEGVGTGRGGMMRCHYTGKCKWSMPSQWDLGKGVQQLGGRQRVCVL